MNKTLFTFTQMPINVFRKLSHCFGIRRIQRPQDKAHGFFNVFSVHFMQFSLPNFRFVYPINFNFCCHFSHFIKKAGQNPAHFPFILSYQINNTKPTAEYYFSGVLSSTVLYLYLQTLYFLKKLRIIYFTYDSLSMTLYSELTNRSFLYV